MEAIKITVENCAKYCVDREAEYPVSAGKSGAWLTVYDFCVQQGMNTGANMGKSAIENVIDFLASQFKPSPTAGVSAEDIAAKAFDYADARFDRMNEKIKMSEAFVFGQVSQAFIAGASSLPLGGDAVEFGEWIGKTYSVINNSAEGNLFWCDETEYEWMGEKERLLTTQQLYDLFIQNKSK